VIAAFLTAAKMDSPVNSAEDLAKQTKIKYGTYCCGSTNAFFQVTQISYVKMSQRLSSAAKMSAKKRIFSLADTVGTKREIFLDISILKKPMFVTKKSETSAN
jgi:hypothetical protein